jgi:hypothetical protein
MHKTYRGVLCFQNVVPSLLRFSLNSQLLYRIMCRSIIQNFSQIGQEMWEVRTAIYLRPQGKYAFHFIAFIWNSQSLNKYLWKSLPTLTHIGRKHVKDRYKSLFTPLSKAWLSLYRFSLNRQLLNIVWKSSIQNFIKIGQQVCKIQKEIHLRRLVTCDWQWADWHETQAYSAFCWKLPYRILWKSDEQSSRWY